jgi:hypothetical protein
MFKKSLKVIKAINAIKALKGGFLFVSKASKASTAFIASTAI